MKILTTVFVCVLFVGCVVSFFNREKSALAKNITVTCKDDTTYTAFPSDEDFKCEYKYLQFNY